MPTLQKCRIVLLFCALLAALVRPGTCAEPKANFRDFAIRTWGSSEGLPDSAVTVIVQTRDGYLWVGTESGLFRFDGLHFTPIRPSKERTNTVISITSLCEDNFGRLWIGTEKKGVYCWQNGQAEHFGTNEGLLDKKVTSLALDNDGGIWIGTGRGVSRYDGHRFSSFTTADGLQDNSVLNVAAARSGRVWITTAGGTCQFVNGKLEQFHFPAGDQERNQEFLQVYEDRQGNLWAFCSTYLINLADQRRINHFPGERSAATRIWNLCEGRGGKLWIGASGRGLFCFDGHKFQPVTLNEGRWPNDVRTIYEDREGNLWLGISGVGLVQLRPQAFTVITESRGLPTGAAACVISDESGQLCVGMESGGIYESKADHFEPLTLSDPFLEQELTASICATTDGAIWAGTSGSGLYQIKNGKTSVYSTANGLKDDSITSLCASSDSSVWVGTRFGAIQRIVNGRIECCNLPGAAIGVSITAIISAPDGGLWIGTSAGKLFHARKDFKNLSPMDLSPRLAGKAILGLCATTNGGVWIGTDGGGLGFVNKDIRRAWDLQDGLPDNVVWGMVEDDEANLWLATPKGICRISGESIFQALARSESLKAKLVYETDDSAPKALRFGGPRAIRSPEGQLWFALNNGLVGVDIRGHEADKSPPQIQIESMLVNHRPINIAPESTGSQSGDVVLSSNPQSLEFRFAGLSFAAPEKVRFRHKLDGIDGGWVQNGTERQIGYGPLPSGHYVFHVTACNAEGIWNDKGTSLAFDIPTPLWRAPWALGTEGVLATFLVVGAVRVVSHRRLRWRLQHLEQQQTMERERIRIAQNMHDEIGSKLTKISYLSERAKTELQGVGRAEGKIDSIATTSRELLKALDEIVWAVNPKNDSVEHLAAYFCQYAREYFQDTNIECDLRMQSKLPHVEMTAEVRHNLFLAFEESLNNILKHAKATRLNMDITTDADCLRITIRDDGCGFEQKTAVESKATGGNGLRNIRQRLSAMGGTCKVESIPGRGSCISLSVPLDSAKIRKR